MSSSVTVYALRCPETRAVFYVGKTAKALEVRLGQHCVSPCNPRLQEKIRSLERKGLRPIIEQLECVNGPDWLTRERWWIAEMVRRGEPLLNAKDHGTPSDARANLYLPAELLEWVKVKAAKERRRANSIIVEALEAARGKEGHQ